MRVDSILIGLGGLLALTLVAFIVGWIPYPFGWIVLSLLIAARAMHRREKANR